MIHGGVVMHARLLHLIDPAECSWPALEMLGGLVGADPGGERHRVVLIGGSGADALARDFGIGFSERIAAPLGKPVLAWRSLRRLVSAWGAPEAIVAWSARTVVPASMVPGIPMVAVMTLPPPMFDGSARWIPLGRALLGSALVVYPSGFLRDSWIARFTLLGCPAAVIPPAFRVSADAEARRRGLQREWGIGEETVVIGALGEPVGEVDAHAAVFAAGVLSVAGKDVVAVVHPGSAHLDRALRFAATIRPRRRVIVDDRPLPSIIHGMDLALWSRPPVQDGERAHRMGSLYTTPLGAVSLALASDAGVPVVAHEHPAWRSVLSERAEQGGMVISVGDRTRLSLTRAILEVLKPRADRAAAARASGPSWGERFEAQFGAVMRAKRQRVFEAA